jgi:uncharacterized protein
MATTTSAAARIITLDVIRGVAVMGILAMNIAAFGMPMPAYMNPEAYGGDSGANLASWFANTLLFDGKMRGLFSILFGASTLLVIQRAAASGRGGAGAHYRRMAFLLLFGLVHFYFIWHGDILAAYALCGLLLYLFRNLTPGALVRWALGLLAVSFLFLSLMTLPALMAGNPAVPADARESIQETRRQIEYETGSNSPKIDEDLTIYRGSYATQVESRLGDQTAVPFVGVLVVGWETLGLMLLGMALFKTGYLTGDWEVGRYRKWAGWCCAIGLAGAAALALLQINSGFDAAVVVSSAMAWSMPFDVLLAIGWAAVVILWVKRGGANTLRDRVAAAGRMAFTNYLMTSIVMTAIFYGWGLGLFGKLDRISLWLPVLFMWGVMLAWSKPWLERFHYGPFEWLWRTLSRMQLQPMRRHATPAAAPA